ncbi:hypothetical protein BDZ85DRAFT_294704 [Elsinoe ampelina]|uniref:Uncharacterized protein n=1 Tax=Elsinoe ampelina TaxID=302913 RepID=A0A6A6GGN5_9PEZI|nr:hypothetical protein BDZ85DRAFT_294704 [Elsinoe ampelina]
MTEEPQSRRNMFKSKWGKIIKADDAHKTGKNAAFSDDVSDFLQSASRSNSVASGGTRPLNLDIAAAQRWPNANQLQQLSTGEYKVPSPLPVDRSGRARRRKDLTVRFVSTTPEIIGHGGDETEVPPMEIGYVRAALQRSLSERRPEQSPELPERAAASPIRPGMRDRAQTARGNTEAYSSLMSAGVFGDRPPSRDNRGADDNELSQPGLKRTQTGFSSTDDSPPPGNHSAYPVPPPPIPPRRALPPRIEVATEDAPGRMSDDRLPSEEWNQDTGRVPRILRKESSEAILKSQQRMRVEEGQAFARAYRLSQTFPAGQEDVRPGSRSSELSYPPPSTGSGEHIPRKQVPHHDPNDTREGMPVRTRPPPSPNRLSGERFLQPGGMQSQERLTPPITPPMANNKPAALAPQDYIEFFKAKTRSRSNSATNRPPSRDTQNTTHDSPLQSSGMIPDNPRLRVERTRDGLQASSQDGASRPEYSAPRSREPTPTSPAVPARRAVPAASPEQSPQSAAREFHSHEQSPLKHARRRSTDQSAHSAGSGHSTTEAPTRKVDPNAAIAFDDFASRVNQMKGVFRLTAQKERPDSSIPTRQWSRCAYWWLHKGRLELETLVRSRQEQGRLTQAHVDIAKAWWVLVEIFEDDASANDAQDAEDIASLRYHLQNLSLWMERQQYLPPVASLIQGQDTRVWLPYPPFSPDVEYLLGCTAGTNKAGEVLPLGDTRDYFFYQRIFVIASLNTDDPRSDRVRLPCTLSMLRHRSHYRASVVIASQSDLINVLVGPELGSEKKGPNWHDVAWIAKSCTMSVNLPRGLALKVNIEEADYRSLSNMIEYTRALDKSFQPGAGETLIYSSQLAEAQYADRSKTHTFPEGKIRRSYIGVFETMHEASYENYVQKSHQGFRLMLITPSTSRTLGLVSRPFDAKSPVLYEIPDVPSDKANPAIILHSPDPAHPWRLLLVFESRNAFQDLLSLFHGTFKTPLEQTKVSLSLRSFTAETLLDSSSSNTNLSVLSRLQWHRAEIITAPTSSTSSTPILSPSLRLILSHSTGTITDRLNFLPGDLLLRLPVDPQSPPTIHLARLPQPSITQSLDRRTTLPGSLDKLLPITASLSLLPTIRTLTFSSRPDLHAFEQELTSYRVLADVSPSLFSITRRRMVVSIVKKLEATRCRVQVLRREEGDVRVAVWFEDFGHAESMAFTVRGSDEFERCKGEKGMRAGGVRLVEAKFSLPKRGGQCGGGEGEVVAGLEGVKGRFVNLEGLEYMEEHDDLVVGFEGQEDLDSLVAALPGPVHAPRTFLSKRR